MGLAPRVAAILGTDEMIEIEDQTAFNLAVWEQVLADPELESLPFRIETDADGHILMSPPPAPDHGEEQSGIGFLLRTFLPHGRIITECPISTTGGVRLTDVAWISAERRRAQRGLPCLTQAPEICVEVLSPKNTRREMRTKRALYFEAGAQEVWFCRRDGTMEFFLQAAPETAATSRLCPDFPARIVLEP